MLIAAGAIALAAIASFRHDLAIDEPFTALAISHPSSLPGTLVHDNVPLFYVLLLGWTRVFGSSAPALRALSMAAFGGAIVFSAAAARRAAGPRAGLVTAALVAGSVAFGLEPAATVRPYALVMMFAAMAVWAAFRERRWGMFAAHLLGVFTHPIAIFYSVAFAAAGAVFGKRRGLAVAPLAAVAVYVIAWGFMVARTAALPATSWMSRPTFADLAHGLLFWGDHATPILAVALLLLVAIRGPRAMAENGSRIGFLLMLAALVLAGTAAVSWIRPVYLSSRTPVLILPAVAIACGIAVASLAPRSVAWAVAGLVAVSAARFTVRSVAQPDPYPTRASLAALAPRMRCGDTIVATGLSYAPIVYDASAAGVPSCVTVRPFPPDIAEHPGWIDLTAAGRAALARDARLAPASLQNAGTVWTFVARRGPGMEAGSALVGELLPARPRRESFALAGSFFDEVLALAGP